jgi:hypothetical protein
MGVRPLRRFAFVAPLFALVPAALIAVAALGACSSSSSGVGQGGECQLATDCADGLVCVPQKDGTRVCSNDLTGVQKTPPTTATDSGTRPPTDGAAASDAPTPDATPDTAPPQPDAAGD